MKKVLFLFGGNSSEHEISCKSVLNIINNIDKDKYYYDIVGITKDNKWICCEKDNIINNNWNYLPEIDNIINFIKKYDIIFPVMHGKYGEDGKLQGMLDLFDIKYVGCKNESSVIGMNKNLSKIFFHSINLPQVPYIKYNNNINQICELGFPVIIKPCNGGSSIGISKANDINELKTGIEQALNYDNNIIVEKFINSREFECAVLENNDLIVSDVGEIKYNNSFYDYEDKYKNKVNLIIPAKIDNDLKTMIKKYSKDVFEKLNCSGLCRIDFLYDVDNCKLYLNEINTMPGFTDISMFPLLMKNEGITYEDLISILIDNAK